MSRKFFVSLLLTLVLCMAVSVTYAQDGPRPTPTDIVPLQPPVETPEPSGQSDALGTVRGFVYKDVNGDGHCMNTGIAGEEPVAGVSIEFVSSDEQYVFNHTSGEDGSYELAGAGQSNWRVTANPEDGWIVTSENPQYGLVAPDHLAAADVNFCIVEGVTAVYPVLLLPNPATEGGAFLPEAGAPASESTAPWAALFLAVGLIVLGLFTRWYEISRK